MKYLARISLVSLCVLTAQIIGSAQSTEIRTPSSGKSRAAAEAAAAQKELRVQARSLLLSLASDARSFGDQRLRARSLARIANALWAVDAEQGRTLFRKAWDAGEIADEQSNKNLPDSNGAFAFNLPPQTLPEVIRLADQHDHALANEFREQLKAKEQAAADLRRGSTNVARQINEPPAPPPRIAIDSALLMIDTEESLLDRVDHAKTSKERDELNFQLAFTMIGKGDLRARDFVDKIEDTEFRKHARPFVDANLALRAIERREPDKALQMAQTGVLSHVQKAWLLAAAAKLLNKTEPQKALFLIEEAGVEAGRIEVSDPDRPRALLAVANALLKVDQDRVWDATFEAVKASNSAAGFTGEDGELNLQLKIEDWSSATTHAEPDFDLAQIFATLANEDYYRAVGLARGFQGEAPRACATIAIARAVLENKNPPIKSVTSAVKPN